VQSSNAATTILFAIWGASASRFIVAGIFSAKASNGRQQSRIVETKDLIFICSSIVVGLKNLPQHFECVHRECNSAEQVDEI
jgi:hypothetical protein